MAEQASTHSRLGVVDDVEEALALLAVHRREDLQTAEGEAIETHVAQAVNASKGGDVPDLVVARQLEELRMAPAAAIEAGRCSRPKPLRLCTPKWAVSLRRLFSTAKLQSSTSKIKPR